MEFQNSISKIQFNENNIVVEIKNLIFNKSKINYLNISYNNIKGFGFFSYNWITFCIYLFAICSFLSSFGNQEHKVDGIIYSVPPTLNGQIGSGILNFFLIIFGYYFSKKYGKFYNLKLKYFEGKVKTSKIFTSVSKDELNKIQQEIQSRLK